MEATTTEAQRAAPPPRLRDHFESEVAERLTAKFGYRNRHGGPAPREGHLNMGVGDAKQTTSVLEAATEQLAVIAGQRPNVRRARKSIANFKVREGMPVGVAVTLRGARMWEFVDRLISIAIPRIRDFRGLNPRSFDGRGNYSLGIREQLIFPEIDYDSIDEVRGLDVTITTSATTDEEAFELLLALGIPVRRRRGGPGAGRPRGRGGGAAQGGGAPARRGRGSGARAAQGGEPRGLREARQRGGGGGGRRGRAEAMPRTRSPKRRRRPSRQLPRNVDGQDFTESQTAAQAEVQEPGLQPLPPLRARRAPTTASSASAGCACASSPTRATSPA